MKSAEKIKMRKMETALRKIWYQAANRCWGDGEEALMSDLEKIERWARNDGHEF